MLFVYWLLCANNFTKRTRIYLWLWNCFDLRSIKSSFQKCIPGRNNMFCPINNDIYVLSVNGFQYCSFGIFFPKCAFVKTKILRVSNVPNSLSLKDFAGNTASIARIKLALPKILLVGKTIQCIINGYGNLNALETSVGLCCQPYTL